MNILVIGGLGYLGYELCQQLSQVKEVKDIHILDCNMFGKFGERDYSHYKMHHINLGDTKLKVKDFNFIKEDKIDKIICCFSPNEKMLSERAMHDYHSRILQNLKKMKSVTPKLVTEILITDQNSTCVVKDYEDDIKTCISDKPVLSFPCPSLFGVSGAFDSSTFINRMILDFATEKYYFLQGDPFEMVSFKGLYHTVQEIVGIVIDKPYGENMGTNCLPKIMIANAVNTMFGFEEYQLHMDVSNIRDFSVDAKIEYVDHKELEHFKLELALGLKKGLMTELLDVTYNNELQIDNIITSCQYDNITNFIKG